MSVSRVASAVLVVWAASVSAQDTEDNTGRCQTACGSKGKCMVGWVTYYCTCEKGYTPGNDKSCCAVECGAHGECGAPKGRGGAGKCVCSDGFTGAACDEAPAPDDPCNKFGCDHGGTCTLNELKQPICTCKGGWEGDHCQNSKCASVKCGKHGECKDGACDYFALMDNGCGELLDALFNARAETRNVSVALNDLNRKCLLDISPKEVLVSLRDLMLKGRCPANAMEGISRTPIEPAVCKDTRQKCQDGIKAGFATCEHDFCPTCALAGQCDETCGICTNSDIHHHHRRALQGLDCDMKAFSSGAKLVTDACCDTIKGKSTCRAGVPSECDARCGVVYNSFYTQCSKMLKLYAPAEFNVYTRLKTTCEEDLPIRPLLQLLQHCGSNQG